MVSGKTINNMGKALKPGKRVLPTKVTMLLAKSRVKASIVGLMDQPTKVIGLTTKSKVSECISGKMAASVMASGLIMICLATESIFMLMELDMMVNIFLIKKKASAFTSGLMEECMKDGGTKENSTDLVHTMIPQKTQSEKDSGKTESVLNGMKRKRQNKWHKEK